MWDTSFTNIGRESVTMQATGLSNNDCGKVVKISENNTVSACSDGDVFFGIFEGYETGDISSVTYEGFIEIDYSGDGIVVGFNELCANGKGGVKKATAGKGRKLFVVEIDENKLTMLLR